MIKVTFELDTIFRASDYKDEDDCKLAKDAHDEIIAKFSANMIDLPIVPSEGMSIDLLTFADDVGLSENARENLDDFAASIVTIKYICICKGYLLLYT